MKKKEVVFIGVLIIIIIIVVVIGAFRNNSKDETQQPNVYYEVFEDGTKLNYSPELHKDKTYNGLKISNIQLTEKDGKSVLLADVTNTETTSTNGFTTMDITFYDDTGNALGVTVGLIKPLAPGETTELNASLTFDYASAYDFKVTEHKE